MGFVNANFDDQGAPLPGGSRHHKFVWADGKPPKYWVILATAFLAFCFIWVLLVVFFWRFGQAVPDSMHSSARLFDGKIYYFPAFVLWLRDFGLLIVMAWMFILAVIMAFYRIMVPRDS
jgi:hypothetical protein